MNKGCYCYSKNQDILNLTVGYCPNNRTYSDCSNITEIKSMELDNWKGYSICVQKVNMFYYKENITGNTGTDIIYLNNNNNNCQ